MAVRPIDASRFGEILEQWKKDCLQDNDTQGADIISDVILQLDDMPTLTPPNEPLTLAELREMDGEPVWDEKGKCYLVDTTYQFCSDSDIEIAIVDKRGIKRYSRRTLYRRPPEGEEDT